MPTTAMLPVCWTRALLDWWRWSEVDFDGDWKQLLQTRALDATQAASLRTATYQGRPFGDVGSRPTDLPNRDLGYDLTIKSSLSRLSQDDYVEGLLH